MTLRNRFLFLGLFLVLPGVSAQAASPVASIHMPGSSQKTGPVFGRLDIPLTQETIAVALNPGQSLDDQTVVLVPGGDGQPGSFKVQTQFETVATIKDEGPSPNPLNWKHHRSEWKDLQPVGNLEYRMPTYTEEDEVRFPLVSPMEMYLAALKSQGPRWNEVILHAKTPSAYAVGVGISTVRLRVLVQDGNEWRELNQIEFSLPLPAGC
jgi:hypothetical protein